MNSARIKKTRILLAVAVLCACALWYGVFYIVKSKVVHTSEVEAKADEATRYQERTRALKSLTRDVEPDMNKLYSRIVSSDGTVSFINTIETLARTNGLVVSTESISETPLPENKEVFGQIGLTFVTQGSWNNSYRFLSLLEALPYKLSIKSAGLVLEEFTSTGTSTRAKKISAWKGSFTILVLKHK